MSAPLIIISPIMTKEIRTLQIFHLALWGAAAAYAALSECGILPGHFIEPSLETTYALNLASIATSIGGGYLALRLLAFQHVKDNIQPAGQPGSLSAFSKWAAARCLLLAAGIWFNVFVYYAASYDMTAAYCLLISLICSVFCWPSKQAARQFGIQEK